MDFIFMLAREDETVADAMAVLDHIAPLGLQHIGLKDMGSDRGLMDEILARLRADGVTTYLEVVDTDKYAILDAAELAAEKGIDNLLGGTDPAGVMDTLRTTAVRYYPYPGRPEGHPIRLGGRPEDITGDCERAMEEGCAGVNLLAFRATDARPQDLMWAARKAIGQDGRLIVAGGVDSPDRLRTLGEVGADAFIVGSAAIECAFSPHKGLLISQLRDVVTARDSVVAARGLRGGG